MPVVAAVESQFTVSYLGTPIGYIARRVLSRPLQSSAGWIVCCWDYLFAMRPPPPPLPPQLPLALRHRVASAVRAPAMLLPVRWRT